MNSKNKSQPSVFVSDWWTKEEENAFRLDIGMTNDEGKLCWGGVGEQQQQQHHKPISHPLFNMHAFKRKAPVLALFLVFQGPGGVGGGEANGSSVRSHLLTLLHSHFK